ncbi:MAG: transposase [Gammaproteobacteria bacterium]
MSRNKKWSAAAKFEIALLAIKGETTLNEICKRYEVAPSQVHAWKKQLLEHGSDLFAKNDKASEAAATELERKQGKLYEKIGELTVERDFLKKSWGKLPGNGDKS